MKFKRWKILITKNVYSYGHISNKTVLFFAVGDILEDCYIVKACDGLWYNVNNVAINIPLDCFDIIKGE